MTLESFLFQIPIVAALMYFIFKVIDRFDKTLCARDEAYSERNSTLVAAITALTEEVVNLQKETIRHDSRIRAELRKARYAKPTNRG